MSLRARTSVPDEWWIVKVTESSKICDGDNADWVPLATSVFGLWFGIVSCSFTSDCNTLVGDSRLCSIAVLCLDSRLLFHHLPDLCGSVVAACCDLVVKLCYFGAHTHETCQVSIGEVGL